MYEAVLVPSSAVTVNVTVFRPATKPEVPVTAIVALASAGLALAATAVLPAANSTTVPSTATSTPLINQVPATVEIPVLVLLARTNASTVVSAVVPLAAVTLTRTLFRPATKLVLPVISTLAPESFATATTGTDLEPIGSSTRAVYGAPFTDKLFKVASEERAVTTTVTFTVLLVVPSAAVTSTTTVLEPVVKVVPEIARVASASAVAAFT